VAKAELPLVPGAEVAGVATDTGEPAVALTSDGGYAEYARAPAAVTFPIPRPRRRWSGYALGRPMRARSSRNAAVSRYVVRPACPHSTACRSRYTTENRGVPGSSPGLAIEESPGNRGLFRSSRLQAGRSPRVPALRRVSQPLHD
jgi:hypothetical protein